MDRRAREKTGRKKADAASPGTTTAGQWFAVLLIVAANLAAYHNSFSGPFIFDDELSIPENPTIRQLWPISHVLLPPGGAVTVTERPLVNLSLALNYAAGGTSVRGYHVVNLVIHTLAALTLFGILRRTFLRPALRRRFGDPALPLAIALLWSVHPLQTEAVTYLIQRAESLMGLFYLLTLYCFIRATEQRPALWQTLAIIACLCGMATKEVMVSAPLMVLLYDRTFVAGSFRDAWRRRWRLYLGLGSTWLLLGWLVLTGDTISTHTAGFQSGVSWQRYAAAELPAIAHYLWLSVWPHPLILDYGGAVLPRSVTAVLPGAFVVVALLAGTVISLRRWPAIGFAGCWFFGILAVTSSVFPLHDTIFEHRMYLPLAAILTLLALAVYSWIGKVSRVAFLLVAVAFIVATARRNDDYRTAETIWSDTVAKRPANERAHNNLGGILLKSGYVEDAMAQFQAAVQLNPDFADAHYNLGQARLRIALSRQEPWDDAIAEFRRAHELNPNDADVLTSLGTTLAMQEKLDDAIDCFRNALRIAPDNATAHGNLGRALEERGALGEATDHYEIAARLQPESAVAHLNLGRALARMGRRAEAIVQLNETLRLEPDNAEAKELLTSLP